MFAAVAVWHAGSRKRSDRKERPFVALDERMSQPIAHVPLEDKPHAEGHDRPMHGDAEGMKRGPKITRFGM
ncbi:MAG: hypothetical protein WBA48_14605 [Xanthobacteraceae bacterium]